LILTPDFAIDQKKPSEEINPKKSIRSRELARVSLFHFPDVERERVRGFRIGASI